MNVIRVARCGLLTGLAWLDRIERRCNAPAAATENKDWNIGCKSADAFDAQGCAGKRYHWPAF